MHNIFKTAQEENFWHHPDSRAEKSVKRKRKRAENRKRKNFSRRAEIEGALNTLIVGISEPAVETIYNQNSTLFSASKHERGRKKRLFSDLASDCETSSVSVCEN